MEERTTADTAATAKACCSHYVAIGICCHHQYFGKSIVRQWDVMMNVFDAGTFTHDVGLFRQQW